ncbi:MAG: glycosyltransferase, partial [Candidatus Hodarchaeota archaeon]
PSLFKYIESNQMNYRSQNEGNPSLLVVGPSNPLKNFHLSLSVFKEIKKEIQNLQLVVTGLIYSPMRKIFQEYCTQYEGDIHYHPFISRKEFYSIIRNSYAVLYPSIEEPFGLVAIEAIALDTPVVGFKSGGLDETISAIYPNLLASQINFNSILEATRRAIKNKMEGRFKFGLKKLENHFNYTFTYIEMAKRFLTRINEKL